jgi:hypothetical protein
LFLCLCCSLFLLSELCVCVCWDRLNCSIGSEFHFGK